MAGTGVVQDREGVLQGEGCFKGEVLPGSEGCSQAGGVLRGREGGTLQSRVFWWVQGGPCRVC